MTSRKTAPFFYEKHIFLKILKKNNVSLVLNIKITLAWEIYENNMYLFIKHTNEK